MRTLYLLVVIYIGLILSSCTTIHCATYQPPEKNTCPCHHHKDPVAVSFLNPKQTPICPYKVLGEAKVSRYNDVGFKRQNATIRDLMREQAASLDGDALINVKKNNQIVTATVIAYKKVLA